MPEYTIQRDQNRCRVVLEGDLTAATVSGLQPALRAEVNQGIKELTFDLERTVMLDSTGIGLLIATHNTLARSQGKVSVNNASPQILQLLQTMRLVTRLNVIGRPTPDSRHG
jgi:anti-sigma B factor antagonist